MENLLKHNYLKQFPFINIIIIFILNNIYLAIIYLKRKFSRTYFERNP